MIHVSRDKRFPKEMKLSFIRQLARETFKISKVTGDITIVFTDDHSIQNLNKEYRKIDAITDILSFPSDEIDPQTDSRYLGDIIISLDRAKAQALYAGRTISEELSMLIVHGCLHLSGYDHTSQTEKETMKSLQESVLLSQGISNYSWPEEE